MSIIIYLRPGDGSGSPLPRPNWSLIDAVAAELGLPPDPWPLPPAGGAR